MLYITLYTDLRFDILQLYEEAAVLMPDAERIAQEDPFTVHSTGVVEPFGRLELKISQQQAQRRQSTTDAATQTPKRINDEPPTPGKKRCLSCMNQWSVSQIWLPI